MALCEQGYLCDVCGLEVEVIEESDLYLRYVLGEVDPETLHVSRKRHLRCNPALAQFIVHEFFEPVVIGVTSPRRLSTPNLSPPRRSESTRGYERLLSCRVRTYS